MAAPIANPTLTGPTASGTSHVINLPSYTAGQWCVIVLWFSSVNIGAATPAGWTLMTSNVNNATIQSFRRLMDGTEGSSVTFTTSAARIVGGWASVFANASSKPPQATSVSTNAAPALNPSIWDTEECLWLTFVKATNAGSGFPTGYTLHQLDLSDTVGHRGAAGRGDLGAVASEDPEAWTGYTGDASSITIGVLGADAGITRPYFAVLLANFAGITDPVSPTWSAASVDPDDLIIVQVEDGTSNIPTISGWTRITGVGGSQAHLNVYYKRSDGTETGCSIAGHGNHAVGSVWVVRDAKQTGDPIHLTATATEEVSDTSISVPGLTTTVADCLVVAFTADGQDNSTAARVTGWANPSLSDLLEYADFGSDAGNGGGVGCAGGGKQVAGVVDATTATQFQAATGKAHICAAFLPRTAPTTWKPKAIVI